MLHFIKMCWGYTFILMSVLMKAWYVFISSGVFEPHLYINLKSETAHLIFVQNSLLSCAFIQLYVPNEWLIPTIRNTPDWLQWAVLYCLGVSLMKGCSHRQEVLGLRSAMSPLPGLIRQEIWGISSLISVSKGQPRSEGRQSNESRPMRPPAWSSSALWEKGQRCLPRGHWPHSRPGGHVELDRFKRPRDIPSSIFLTLPHARVSHPLNFQVLKRTCNHGGYEGLRSGSHGKTLWGRFIHL